MARRASVPGQVDLKLALRNDIETFLLPRVASGFVAGVSSRAPRGATGRLAGSIRGETKAKSKNVYRVTVSQVAEIAPYGAALDHPKAGRITAKKGRALRFDPGGGGGPIFRRSVRQSTKHEGWWAEAVEGAASDVARGDVSTAGPALFRALTTGTAIADRIGDGLFSAGSSAAGRLIDDGKGRSPSSFDVDFNGEIEAARLHDLRNFDRVVGLLSSSG